ncbi:hypothetical protein ACWDCB_03070 [Streptomyces sp. NPDC001178]
MGNEEMDTAELRRSLLEEARYFERVVPSIVAWGHHLDVEVDEAHLQFMLDSAWYWIEREDWSGSYFCARRAQGRLMTLEEQLVGVCERLDEAEGRAVTPPARAPERRDAEPTMPYHPLSRQFAENEADYRRAMQDYEVPGDGWG